MFKPSFTRVKQIYRLEYLLRRFKEASAAPASLRQFRNPGPDPRTLAELIGNASASLERLLKREVEALKPGINGHWIGGEDANAWEKELPEFDLQASIDYNMRVFYDEIEEIPNAYEKGLINVVFKVIWPFVKIYQNLHNNKSNLWKILRDQIRIDFTRDEVYELVAASVKEGIDQETKLSKAPRLFKRFRELSKNIRTLPQLLHVFHLMLTMVHERGRLPEEIYDISVADLDNLTNGPEPEWVKEANAFLSGNKSPGELIEGRELLRTLIREVLRKDNAKY